jgi:hypothetical protein
MSLWALCWLTLMAQWLPLAKTNVNYPATQRLMPKLLQFARLPH